MSNLKQLFESGELILLDFYAEWCGPCKMMVPVLKEIKDFFGKKIRVIKIDIDNPRNNRPINSYNVRSVPTLILIKNNDILWKNSGAVDRENLKQIIKKYI